MFLATLNLLAFLSKSTAFSGLKSFLLTSIFSKLSINLYNFSMQDNPSLSLF